MAEKSRAKTDPLLVCFGWEEILGTACKALLRSSRTGLRSITVECILKGVDGESKQLLSIARRLAMEFDLSETIEIYQTSVAVRYERCEAVL